MLKQVILIRRDLGLSRGKIAAQACHASLEAYERSEEDQPNKTRAWSEQGSKKIVLWVKDREELEEIRNELPGEVPKAEIIDAGETEIEPGTKTALGIGPWEEKKLDKYTGHLNPVK